MSKTGFTKNNRLEKWGKVLQKAGLRVSRSKTEALRIQTKSIRKVRLDGDPIPDMEKFKYLGSMVDNTCSSADVQNRIKQGWQKWRSLTGVLFDRKMPDKVKGKA